MQLYFNFILMYPTVKFRKSTNYNSQNQKLFTMIDRLKLRHLNLFFPVNILPHLVILIV